MSRSEPPSTTRGARWLHVTAWFLAITYGVGAVVTGFLELDRQLFSERFGYPPALIFAVCAVQLVCALAVLNRRLAPLAAAGLTVTTLGAVASHVRIGSPWTALPAAFFTVVQVWFGLASRQQSRVLD